MSIPPAWPLVLDFFGRPLVIEPSDGQLSSDAGLLPIRQFDDRIGLTRAFTDVLDDSQAPPANHLDSPLLCIPPWVKGGGVSPWPILAGVP